MSKPAGADASTWSLCVAIALEKKRIVLKEVSFTAFYIGGSIAAVVAGGAVAGPVGAVMAGTAAASLMGGFDVYKTQLKLTEGNIRKPSSFVA